MYCCRSTPTVPPCVVATDWQPAARAAERATGIRNLGFMPFSNVFRAYLVDSLKPLAFQGIGQNKPRQGYGRRKAESKGGAGYLPRPPGEQRADRAAGAVADAREERLA